MNWDLLLTVYDPAEQIEWLSTELAAIEQAGGQAIIISHIPIRDCIHSWGYRYRGLMDRYQNIIRFSLFGHTHLESISLTRSIKEQASIGLGFIAPSLTTYTGYHPSFTIIEIDEEYMIPIAYKTYYFNIT